MLYAVEYGELEKTLIRHARQNRQSLPAPILNAPELNLGLQVYLQAFFDLQADRQSAFSIGRIPSKAIRDYGKDMQFDEDQIDLLNRFVRDMDSAYVKFKEKNNGDSTRLSGTDAPNS